MNKTIAAGILAVGAAGVGATDAAVLREQPVAFEATIKNERVVVEQKGNVVEAALPWKDQPGLRVKYDMGQPTVRERVQDKRKAPAIVEQVTDGLKIDIILNEKPDTNRFCYQIEGWEDYDFFYQPPLTKQEIADGAERPEEIVGSYAVYHKTLKNHRVGGVNYENGKVAHIPYPYIWSLNATSSTKRRAEAFDITEGNMCVTVAQSDLDTMEYPIRVDPTFGYTSAGGSTMQISYYADYDHPSGNVATIPENGTLDSVSAYIKRSSLISSVGWGVYEKDSAGANSHGQVFSGSTGSPGITYSWRSITAGDEVLSSGTDYLILVQILTGFGGQGYMAYDITSGFFVGPPNYAYYVDDPISSSVDSGLQFSIYVTYTATGGGGSTVPATEAAILF